MSNANANARKLFHASTTVVIFLIILMLLAAPVSAVSTSTSHRTSLFNTKVTVQLESYYFFYTGEEIRPAINIFIDGTKQSKSDYELTYFNNINVGKAFVKVTGKNNLSGFTFLSFSIIDLGQCIADYASSDEFVGLKYVYGGTDKTGFDCSGFVQYVFHQFGIELPRTADSQMWCGKTIYSINDLLPGDIVAFYGGGHVGIYIGNGQFVHAANSRVGLIITSFYNDPSSGDHYANNFSNGARVI